MVGLLLYCPPRSPRVPPRALTFVSCNLFLLTGWYLFIYLSCFHIEMSGLLALVFYGFEYIGMGLVLSTGNTIRRSTMFVLSLLCRGCDHTAWGAHFGEDHEKRTS